MTVAVSSGIIRQAMLNTWAAPQYAIMWEVGDATGARQTRFADAVMMSLWPSRGLELHGVEIKVSRSDWRREAADPKKAETIARYCDRWWVHTAPGVVHDLAEVPPLWGLREFDGKRWKTVREATKRDADVPTRSFLAAILRRSDETQRADVRAAADRMVAADRDAFEKRIEDEVARRTRRHGEALAQIKAFEEASGLTFEGFYGSHDAKAIGDLVKVIRVAGVLETYMGVAGLRAAARAAYENIELAIAESGLPFPEEPTKAARTLQHFRKSA